MPDSPETFRFGPWLKSIIDRRGITVAEFRRLTGMSNTTVHRWFTAPTASLSAASAGRVAKAIGMPLEAMRLAEILAAKGELDTNARAKLAVFDGRVTGVSPALDQNVDRQSIKKLITSVPTFDLSVAAGGWVEVDGMGEVYGTAFIDQGLFRVRIEGESMLADYSPQDVIEFQVFRAGRDVLEIGADYYVHRSDDTATFKRLAEVDEDELVFRAINKKRFPEPIRVPRQEVVRMAVALAKVTIIRRQR